MSFTLPSYKSKLSQPFQANNFTPIQSANGGAGKIGIIIVEWQE